ncbi:hypothetical protein B7494_g2345 [Chlorociboria aeruginascens]|nr:hypothetical protein B7494_g2345 [Chlorociboria aeruginascens]
MQEHLLPRMLAGWKKSLEFESSGKNNRCNHVPGCDYVETISIGTWPGVPQIPLKSKADHVTHPRSRGHLGPGRSMSPYENRTISTRETLTTSARPREIGGSYASKRGHVGQLSISDSNHHVTEAIGDMYGDDDDYPKHDARPLSFQPSPQIDHGDSGNQSFEANRGARRPSPAINGNVTKKAHTSPALMQSPRSSSFENGALSPSLSLREHPPSDPANAQFPLNHIYYESNSAAVAQELSNLQALRRMSMDVGNTSDPDLPSFQGVSLMPSVAPTSDDNEDDPSRLFWVPARVHPELAPMEFKTFLENRVQSIKRRSGDQASLSPDGIERGGSGGGLRRKKSMLSRQIDNSGGRGAVGYKDGAEQLERKKSLSTNQSPDLKIADLKELDALVRDPSRAMQKLSLDTGNRQEGLGQVPTEDDMPILPQAPGIGLRRSTRTTYRRGSLRKGERVPFSKRAGSIRAETDGEESPVSSPIDGRNGFPLVKVHSEPTTTENFSRPNRGGRRGQQTLNQTPMTQGSGTTLTDGMGKSDILPKGPIAGTPPVPGTLPRNHTFPRNDSPVPRIVETPPSQEDPVEISLSKQTHQFPERSSSQILPPPIQQPQVQPQPQQVQIVPEPPARSSKRPVVLDRQNSPSPQPMQRISPPNQTLNEMAQHPSPLPGNSARTDSLTFIPTLDEKKHEKKVKKDESDSGLRKGAWGWFKGSDEKEKKDRKKDDDHKEAKKSKTKVPLDKPHDIARLDVLQSTMDTAVARGRESLLIDRDSIENKLQDERRKESSRKSSGESKKEKDSLFSSLFGGGKKKSDRDTSGKKGSSLRTLSPDPPHRHLKPDIDYNWTRFSIMEERAIYRMAHIKLANPRRALYSQVLLSNFMYSYLAKVQQMQPQMQVPQSVQQKKLEAERRQKEQQRQEGGEQYRYDYHQGITQYAEPRHDSKSEGVSYVDDSQIYDYDHQDEESSHGHDPNRPQSRASQHNNENGYNDPNTQYSRHGKDYYPYGQTDSHDHDHENDDEEMW